MRVALAATISSIAARTARTAQIAVIAAMSSAATIATSWNLQQPDITVRGTGRMVCKRDGCRSTARKVTS